MILMVYQHTTRYISVIVDMCIFYGIGASESCQSKEGSQDTQMYSTFAHQIIRSDYQKGGLLPLCLV